MSSHHFVREGQEPDVWILGNDLCLETLGTLLEWSPAVIAGENAVELLLSLRIKIDKVVTKTQTTELKQLLEACYPVEWIAAEPRQYLLDSIMQYRKPVYLLGQNDKEISALYNDMVPAARNFLVAISVKRKWISPADGWKKWVAQGARLILTEDLQTWKISGEIALENHQLISLKDQVLVFEHVGGLIGEYL